MSVKLLESLLSEELGALLVSVERVDGLVDGIRRVVVDPLDYDIDPYVYDQRDLFLFENGEGVKYCDAFLEVSGQTRVLLKGRVGVVRRVKGLEEYEWALRVLDEMVSWIDSESPNYGCLADQCAFLQSAMMEVRGKLSVALYLAREVLKRA